MYTDEVQIYLGAPSYGALPCRMSHWRLHVELWSHIGILIYCMTLNESMWNDHVDPVFNCVGLADFKRILYLFGLSLLFFFSLPSLYGLALVISWSRTVSPPYCDLVLSLVSIRASSNLDILGAKFYSKFDHVRRIVSHWVQYWPLCCAVLCVSD